MKSSANAALERLSKRYGEVDARDGIELVLADPSAKKAEVTDALAVLELAREQLDFLEGELLKHGRDMSMSWRELAAALGVSSRQAAEQRYLRRVLKAGGRDLKAARSMARQADDRRQVLWDHPAVVLQIISTFVQELYKASAVEEPVDETFRPEYELTPEQEVQVTAVQVYLAPQERSKLNDDLLKSLAAAAVTLARSVLTGQQPVPDYLLKAVRRVMSLEGER